MRIVLVAYAAGVALPFLWVGIRLWILRRSRPAPRSAEVIPFVAQQGPSRPQANQHAAGPIRNVFTVRERDRLHDADIYLERARDLRQRSKVTKPQ